MNQQIQTKARDNQEVEIDLVDLLGYYMSKLPLLIAAIVIGALVAGLITSSYSSLLASRLASAT